MSGLEKGVNGIRETQKDSTQIEAELKTRRRCEQPQKDIVVAWKLVLANGRFVPPNRRLGADPSYQKFLAASSVSVEDATKRSTGEFL